MPVDDDLKAAKVELVQAQARKATAEALKAEREARGALAGAETQEHNLMLGREKWKQIEAQDDRHQILRFVGGVDKTSVEFAMAELTSWLRLYPEKKDYTVIFQSPGGSVVDGLAFWDFLQELRSDHGIHLTTIARGYAASMAGILLQAGDVRKVGRESWILIHQVQASAMGSWGEIQDRTKWLERIQERILDIFVDRARASACETPITRTKLKKNWERTDWWIPSDEALRLGIVDEVC